MDLGQPIEDSFGFRQQYDEVSRIGSLPPTTSSASATDFAWVIGIAFAVGEKLAIPVEYEYISGDIDKAAMFGVPVVCQF
ncbi:hypothetical protein [Kaarinaea lacus]